MNSNLKPRSSIVDLSQQIDNHPEDPLLYYRRGVEWSHKGVFELALADFTRAISLKDDFAKAYYGRATVYNSLKEYDKAEKDFARSHLILKSLRSREDLIRRN